MGNKLKRESQWGGGGNQNWCGNLQKLHVCIFCSCTHNLVTATAWMSQKKTLSRLIWAPDTKWFIVYIVHMLMQVNTCMFRFTSSKNATKPPLSILKELSEFLEVQILDKGWTEVPHQCLHSFFFMRWFYFFIFCSFSYKDVPLRWHF